MAFSTNNSSISKLFILQASVTHGCYNSTLNILQAILQHGFVLQLHGVPIPVFFSPSVSSWFISKIWSPGFYVNDW